MRYLSTDSEFFLNGSLMRRFLNRPHPFLPHCHTHNMLISQVRSVTPAAWTAYPFILDLFVFKSGQVWWLLYEAFSPKIMPPTSSRNHFNHWLVKQKGGGRGRGGTHWWHKTYLMSIYMNYKILRNVFFIFLKLLN